MMNVIKSFKAFELLSVVGFFFFAVTTAYLGDFSSAIISINGLVWVLAYNRLRLSK